MADEAFHEIQLNGKQLVFLFMAATVVAVVIFLCGVMVGRGVRVQHPGEAPEVSIESAVDPTAETRPAAITAPAESARSSSSQENLTYPQRLEDPTNPPETLKEPSPADVSTAVTSKAQAAAPAKTETGRADAPAAHPEPSGDGFAVQVAAIRERGEADTIAKRLQSRGYPAYVITPAAGAPRVYRVRVGKFKDRREAETIATRLEREEQFRPWITR